MPSAAKPDTQFGKTTTEITIHFSAFLNTKPLKEDLLKMCKFFTAESLTPEIDLCIFNELM